MGKSIDIIEHKDNLLDVLSEFILLRKENKLDAAFIGFTRNDGSTRNCWFLPENEFAKFNLLLDQMKSDLLIYQREGRDLDWEQEKI